MWNEFISKFLEHLNDQQLLKHDSMLIPVYYSTGERKFHFCIPTNVRMNKNEREMSIKNYGYEITRRQ
jgi:hypothetical protein